MSNNWISSGISGGISLVATWPMEYLKTIKQLPNNNNKKIFNLVKKDIKLNGITTIYKGLAPQLITSIPRTSIRFTSFNYFNKLFNNQNKTNIPITFSAGLFAGMMESITIYTPSEVIKVQAIKNSNLKSSQIIKNIYKNNGLKGFYQGLLPTIYRQSTTQGFSFLGNTISKKYYINYFDSSIASLLAGITGGAFAVYVNNPLDVIKTTSQSYNKNVKISKIINNIYQDNGIKGFYKGSLFRCLRVAPLHGITFFCFDYINKILN